jgi:hypothetical protein
VAARCQLAASIGDLAMVYDLPARAGWLPYDKAGAAARRSGYLGAAGGKLVGLSWQVADTPCHGLEPFAPLLEIPGIRWVALPVGQRSQHLTQFIASLGEAVVYDEATDGQSDLLAFRDQLAPLDLLIASDDLSAMLAEAVNRPVWKIVSGASHWSWRAGGEASKWHPGVRLFRDGAARREETIEALRVALAKEAGFPL